MFTATYSPDDNKLRLYASARLDSETYARVKAAGFKWAPKQELFVAPMWTPGREDLLLELAGEIEDEDKSLVERAEERADRFEDYSEKRLADAEAARSAVKAIADNIPFGQPILVGHHSEKHARRDAERIENGMRKAVKLWRTSQYWTARASEAVSAAKYKELPAVRARRIKTLEADKRKRERTKAEAEKWLKLWSLPSLTHEQAVKIANVCWLHLPRKEGDREDLTTQPTAYDALTNCHPTLYAPRTLEEIIETAKRVYPKTIERANRWIEHYENRLAYERAMLAGAGGIPSDRTAPEVGGAIRCWASHRGCWSYITKVNKVTVTVLDNWGNGGRNFRRTIKLDDINAIMSKADVEAARSDGRLVESSDGVGFALAEAPQPIPEPQPEPQQAAPEPEQSELFQQMADTLKAGVKVVTAPQLFVTPADVAERIVALAKIETGQRVLEPSAGTGALLDPLFNTEGTAWLLGDAGALVAVERNTELAAALRRQYVVADVRTADFLQCNGDLGTFDRVVMNPPFENGADIKHIRHALGFLKPGGRLVAICANGPRQQDQLKPLAAEWFDLPAGTFKDQGTMVNTAIAVFDVGGDNARA